MVGTVDSTELSHSMMVDDLPWSRKAAFQGDSLRFSGDLLGDRNALPFEPARQFNPSTERHSQLQFCLPTEPGISEQFSRIQLNALPESPSLENPAKSGGLPDSRAEPFFHIQALRLTKEHAVSRPGI